MSEENERILESCQRYVDAGIYNRNVALQYQRLTGKKMAQSNVTGVLGFKRLVLDHLYGVMWYLLVGAICLGCAGGLNIGLLAWFDGLVILLVSCGCLLELLSLFNRKLLIFYYVDRDVINIKKCKAWLLDTLLGKGVLSVSTTDDQLILESCERYIEKGIKNKYVVDYYKRLTGKELDSTSDKHILNKKYIVFECVKNTVYGMLFAYILDVLLTMFQVYEFINIRVLLLVGVTTLYSILKNVYVYFIKPKKCKTLEKFPSSYVDYITGRGCYKLSKEIVADE